jgi:RNA polymerase sigma-70 factor, ECF subfamily
VVSSQPAEGLFDALYSAHRQTLHAYFLGKTGDPELALDLVQDAFIRVWRNLGTVADLSAQRQTAWLYSVARNLVIDQYRAHATRRAAGDALARQTAASDVVDAPPADLELNQREDLQVVDAAIRRLPEDLRVVLVLQVLGERNSTEIGELLGRPAGTVRYQLSEARRRLARDTQLRELLRP